MKKRMISLLLALVICFGMTCVTASAEENAIPPAGVLSFLNYSEDEFAQASVIWNYLGITLFNNGYVSSEVMTPMEPSYALAATAADYPVKFYDTLDSMVMGLLSGEIISFDIYSCVAKYICAQNDQLVNYVTYDTTSERSAFVAEVLDRFSNGFSFMMTESRADLRDEFNQAIEAMKADQGMSDVDDFDFICHVAFDKKPLTRRERANNVKKRDFLSKYSGTAREVLEALLDKYMNVGVYEIEKTEILQLDPFLKYGKPAKIASFFGGKAGYLKAVKELENMIYNDEAV